MVREDRATSFGAFMAELDDWLDDSRRAVAWAVDSIRTATKWEVGRRTAHFLDGLGDDREARGAVVRQMAADLTAQWGKGFSRRSIYEMLAFYRDWEFVSLPDGRWRARVRRPGVRREGGAQPPLSEFTRGELVELFPLPWSHYVALLRVEDLNLRARLEEAAIRGRWSLHRLERAMGTK